MIERADLDARLAHALQSHRLVLIVAPAGYGKTATLSRQSRHAPSGNAFAWVTADAEDSLQRLIACLVEALEPYDPPWRVAPEALDAHISQELGLRRAADEFLNALGATPVPHGVIAFDDLHSVADTRVFEFISLLLDGLPEKWTLAICSRVEPPLPLSRLRARRELAEFRQADLSFTRTEIDKLCEAIEVADRVELAQRLEDRTQGWPAGLSLSLDARVLQESAGSPGARLSQRHLFDYLASEVFDQMPEDLREFLLDCSVLPELTPSRCAVVSANARAAALLEEVERRGLFVSVLEGDELTLRLHDLFRDFLDDRLRRLHPDRFPTLLRRAAQDEADPVRQVNFLLRAGAWQEAEAVLVATASQMLQSGDSAQVIQLIEQFPAQEQEHSPRLQFLRGQCAWLRYEFDVMQRSMSSAAAGFEAEDLQARAQHARAYEAISMLYIGRLADTHDIASALLHRPLDVEAEILGQLANYWLTCIEGPAWAPGKHLDRAVSLLVGSGRSDLWTFCVTSLYIQVDRAGVTEPTERFLYAASQVATRGNIPLQAALRTIATKLQLMRGHILDAHVSLKRLRDDHAWLGEPASLATPLKRLTAWYHTLRGNKEEARQAVMNLANSVPVNAQPRAPHWLNALMYFIVAQNAIAMDDWDTLRDAGRKLESTDRTAEWPSIEGCRLMVRGALAFNEGRLNDALPALRASVAVAERLGGLGKDATERVTLARAELRNGSPREAWRVLAPLLGMVSPLNLVGILLLQGPSALEELVAGIGPEVAPAADRALLARAATQARELRQHGPDGPDPIQASAVFQDKTLTPRERDVLARIAAGESNKLIARALNLSPHTVKRHVAHILTRLDVSSRGQAAAWYLRDRGG